MSPFLVFQLQGSLASWGTHAVGVQRNSANHPSRSAVIGLVAASLGIRRERERTLQGLAESLKVGIKMVRSGGFLVDYHTIRAPRDKKDAVWVTRRDELTRDKLTRDKKDINCIVSKREYRVDGYWLVALSSDGNPGLLETIKTSLEFPQFTTYMGRKACPLGFPMCPEVISTDNMLAAFEKYGMPFLDCLDDSTKKMFQEETITYFWEKGIESGIDSLVSSSRCCIDDPISRKRWQFCERTEYWRTVGAKEGQ